MRTPPSAFDPTVYPGTGACSEDLGMVGELEVGAGRLLRATRVRRRSSPRAVCIRALCLCGSRVAGPEGALLVAMATFSLCGNMVWSFKILNLILGGKIRIFDSYSSSNILWLMATPCDICPLSLSLSPSLPLSQRKGRFSPRKMSFCLFISRNFPQGHFGIGGLETAITPSTCVLHSAVQKNPGIIITKHDIYFCPFRAFSRRNTPQKMARKDNDIPRFSSDLMSQQNDGRPITRT